MRKFGLIGHPVSHSKSPQIHVAAYQDLGLTAEYAAFDIPEDDLAKAIELMKVNGFEGLNVTIPHKVKIMEYLDSVGEDAKLIGAVNTIVKEGDRLVGRNTDADGYMESLLGALRQSTLAGSNVLVIGAGGAARAVVYGLTKHNANITIANRTLHKAEQLAMLFSSVNMETVTIAEAENQLSKFDIVINTSSVGMYPDVTNQPIDLAFLAIDALVSDLIYNPLETQLIKAAKHRGNPVLTGVEMFVNQAALSISHWTGLTANREKMKAEVLKHL